MIEKYRDKRIIVLGSAGFIGRWVARGLSAAGADLYLPVRNVEAANRVFGAFGISGEIFETDLMEFEGVRRLIREVRPSATFNLAGYGIDRSEKDEKIAREINSLLPLRLCEAISETKDSEWAGLDLIHAGTAMEYGAARGDLSEDSEMAPTTVYGRTKLGGSSSLAEGSRLHDIRAVTARLFAVYGPGEMPGRLLPALLEMRDSPGDLELTEGRHKRDFTFVEDVSEGILRLGLAACRPGEAVNLATGVLTSIREFAETAARVIGIGAERLVFGALPTRPEEMDHDPVSIVRLKTLTGWSPSTSIEDGVRKTASFVSR